MGAAAVFVYDCRVFWNLRNFDVLSWTENLVLYRTVGDFDAGIVNCGQ